jgi:tRNA A-37 threonylcarbamoyl transferase component Bud32
VFLRIQKWLWGDVPAGFKKLYVDRTQMMVVREGAEPYLNPEMFVTRRGREEEAGPFQGRGNLTFLRLGNGQSALVRQYHHGGLLRHLTGELFFTWPPRPFKELALTEEARLRGIPTLEIMGAYAERVWGPFYRGWLVTCELEGAHDLWAALQSDWYAKGAGRSCLQAVAVTIRRMHVQGLYHGDLNLKNILVRREGDALGSYIIDFDKARLFSAEVPKAKAQQNLARFLRSVCKLDPERRYLSQQDWELFVRFYREAKAG